MLAPIELRDEYNKRIDFGSKKNIMKLIAVVGNSIRAYVEVES